MSAPEPAHDQPSTIETITTAFNNAADAVLDETGRDDERIVDIVNLVVNAGLHFAQHPDDTLFEAIEANYDDAPSLVLSWVES